MGKSFVLLLFCVWHPASAQTFEVVYSFADVTTTTGTVSPGPAPSVPGLMPGTFTAVGVSSNPNASGRFSFTGWDTGASDAQDDQTQYTGSLSAFKYYELALSVVQGYSLHLKEISFSMRRSGTGIRHFCVRSDVDGFTKNIAASTQSNSKLMVNPDDVFFWLYDNTSTVSDQKGSTVKFAADHHDLTGGVLLRFYAWNAESSGGSFSIDDVSVKGVVADSVTISGVSNQIFTLCGNDGSLKLSDLGRCGYERIRVFDLHGALLWQNSSDAQLRLSGGIYVVIAQKDQAEIRRKIFVAPE